MPFADHVTRVAMPTARRNEIYANDHTTTLNDRRASMTKRSLYGLS
jgi:hypothetical protein